MHLNKIHGILRRAGLKPYSPIRGVHVGYGIYAEQLPFEPVRYVCVYMQTTTHRDTLPLEQAQEAAVAALRAAGLEVEAAETIDGLPSVEFAVTTSKTYRRLRVHSTERTRRVTK